MRCLQSVRRDLDTVFNLNEQDTYPWEQKCHSNALVFPLFNSCLFKEKEVKAIYLLPTTGYGISTNNKMLIMLLLAPMIPIC